MVSPVPLRADLGAGRVQLELAEELRALGHVVETFDLHDAFPRGVPRRRLSQAPFAERARMYLRRHADRFDVVDALQGALPFDKQELCFNGLLVARSVGLYVFYDDFRRYAAERWPHLVPGTRVGQVLRRRLDALSAEDCRRSLSVADLALFLTDQEVDWAVEEFGRSDRWQALPNGLTDAHRVGLTQARGEASRRLDRAEVSFVGTWSLRKGSADWPELMRAIADRVPRARFLLLGTHESLPALGGGRVRVVPSFRPDELPQLLAGSAAGLLPTYAEGWGIGVLEQLAAGIPTVAYDVSGPRAMLGALDDGLLVPCGAVRAAADRVAGLLALQPAEYSALSDRCVCVATQFSWASIARRTADLYVDRLGRLGL
jgi:glycosyltransferase involved in cell wall biosynthesis